MPTSWIEVVDSAIKIGLGAAISGFATYLVASRSHKHSVHKDLLARKIALLESAAARAEDYFYFCMRLNNAVGGILRKAENPGQAQTEGQRKRIRDIDSGLAAALESRNQAISKLELLAVSDATNALVECNDTLSRYRSIVIFDGRLPTTDERDEMTAAYRSQTATFYTALSKYFAALES